MTFVDICNSIYEFIKQNRTIVDLSPYGIFNAWADASTVGKSIDEAHLEEIISYIADVTRIFKSEVCEIL